MKFIRFAQWRIEKTGHGILAFVTNHGYLDNPTFRGMRQSLMQSFNDIYILDLHGNSKKREQAPDGSKDENVFDIQQGVAIGIFVKRPQQAKNNQTLATVHHAHLWGMREIYDRNAEEKYKLIGGKYHWLAEHTIATTEWSELQPNPPFYLFVPQSLLLRTEYEVGRKLTDIMPAYSLGFQSHRDHFAVDFDKSRLLSRISEMHDSYTSDQEYAEKYHLVDNRDWQLSKARQLLRADVNWQDKIIRCSYRPFDQRFCYFSNAAIERSRTTLRQHMLHPNKSLNVVRQTKAQNWRHAMVATTPTPALFTEIKDGSSAFPLYLYSTESTLNSSNSPNRSANLSASFIDDITARLHLTFIPDGRGDLQQTLGPEDIFSYMYTIFHSPTYRQRYAEFLKLDFPRLPLTTHRDLFFQLVQLGNRLIDLHAMEKFAHITSSYPIAGDNVVERAVYTASPDTPESGRVWINKNQYFSRVPREIWEFHVGGYQVCQKWLKDRKGLQLSFSDIEHYQRIIAALAETILLMRQIDDAIAEYGGWPLG